MITRRRVACAGGASLLGAHRLSHGQSTAPPRRVGLLLLGSEVESAPRLAALAQGMRELGWLEGTNVEFRPAFADGDANRLATLAGELVTQKVEVIVVGGSQGVRAAQRASRAIPIVMTNVGDPVADEFVASLARPGGNITGTSNQAPEVLAKVIEILHEVAPRARRIAVLLNEDNPSHPRQWAAAQRACAALNLVPLRVVASAPAQLGAAVDQIARLKAQAVAAQARNYPGKEREIFETYQRNPALLAQVRAPIYEEKVVDYILELITVTNETVSREALFADDDEAPIAAAAEAEPAKPKKPRKRKAEPKAEADALEE